MTAAPTSTRTAPSRPAPSRAARSGRAVPVLLAVLLLLPTLVVAGPADRAAAAGPAARIEVATLDPTTAGPRSTLRVTGSVANTGTVRLSDVEVRLRLSTTPVSSRGELSRIASGDSTAKDGEVVATQSVTEEGGAGLARGRSAPFDLDYGLAEAGLDQFGVHVVVVEVIATVDGSRDLVAAVRTFLPFVPARPDFRPAGFTWLWPLVGRPERLADGTYADDRLALEMAPGGRLDRLVERGVELAAGQQLTWVVDPELLETAEDMSDGYLVRTRSGGLVPGAGTFWAADWLTAVRSATTGAEVLSLPYGDPDLVALHRGGFEDDLLRAREQGPSLAAQLLGRTVTEDVTWPIDGFVDRTTLGWLRGSGTRAALLNGRAVPTTGDLSFTPGGRTDVRVPGGPVPALVADPGLAGQLADPQGPSLLAAQRFLAETAMITAERPGGGGGRTVLVMPPRRWSPAPPLLDRVVAGATVAPWLGPVTLQAALTAVPAEDVKRADLRYPAASRAGELPPSYLAALRDLHGDVDVFADVLVEPQQMQVTLAATILRLESSWWRRRPARIAQLDRDRAYLAGQMRRVRVLPGSYTFASSRGTIPLTIANDLDAEVLVDVAVTPQTRRLETGDVDPVRIGPQRKVQIEVPATAVANGLVIVDATLQTTEGVRFNPPVPLRVRVTQFGTVALYITLFAAGVLFLAAGFQLVRRLVRERRAGPGAGPGAEPDQSDQPVEDPEPAS